MFYQIHHGGSSEYLKREPGENFSYPPHLHQCFELVTILDGEMTITVSNQTHKLYTGDAILIFPNELHSLSSKTSKHLLFIFSPKLIQAFSTKYQNKLPKERIITPEPYLISALSTMHDDASSVEIKGVLYSIAALVERDNLFIDRQASDNQLIMKIFSFVENNFKTDCSLYDISASIGYDHAYLSRYFKKITGMSYSDYVNLSRLNHASYLLKNSNLSILECSIESGYHSLRTFNRNFKEYFGITPIEYRKSNLN
jgi:YesN/AraC family two-component response regulator